MTAPEFVPFPKMARHSRRVVVTEKIDGTNAQVHITDAGEVFAGSRNRWITPTDDNYGFAKWVEAHREELLLLGPGSHFGEWWGSGIQRRYGMTEKAFSLFNVGRWTETPPPACCRIVPVLWDGPNDQLNLPALMVDLMTTGSHAAPGFMDPEGVIVFHTAAKVAFKKTLKDDAEPKSVVAARGGR